MHSLNAAAKILAVDIKSKPKLKLFRFRKQISNNVCWLLLVDFADACGRDGRNRSANVSQLSQTPQNRFIINRQIVLVSSSSCRHHVVFIVVVIISSRLSSFRCRCRHVVVIMPSSFRRCRHVVVVVISSSCRRCHHVVVMSSSCRRCHHAVVMSSLSSCRRCRHFVVVSSCRHVVIMSSSLSLSSFHRRVVVVIMSLTCRRCRRRVIVVISSSSSSSSLCRHRLVVNIIVVIAELRKTLDLEPGQTELAISLFRQICLGQGQHQPTNPCSGIPMKTSTAVTTEDSIYLPETLPQADKSVARPYVIRAIYIWYTMDKAIRLTCVCMAIYQKKNLI